MAVIFFLVFAFLGFLIKIVFDKFLLEEGEFFSEEASSGETVSKKGQAVDIVIQDEDLPSDENTNQYFVGANHQMLNSEDIRKDSDNSAEKSSSRKEYKSSSSGVSKQSVANANKTAMDVSEPDLSGFVEPKAESSGDKQFVPVRNLETLYNVSGKEGKTAGSLLGSTGSGSPSADSDVAVNNSKFTAADEELDTLPDMDSAGFGNDDSVAPFSEDEVNNESDFATKGVVKPKRKEPEVQDAQLMAKTISTLLANES